MVTRYFTQLFQCTWEDGKLSERERVNQVTDEENEALCAPVTIKEVKEAVFSMQPEKSPGPDDLNPAFLNLFGVSWGEMYLKSVRSLCIWEKYRLV